MITLVARDLQAGMEVANRRKGIRPITARGLIFEARGRRLIDNIDFDVPGDCRLVVMGPNGAGKSLLLRMLAGLVHPCSGSVTWQGNPPDRDRATRLGFVFQKPVLLRRSVHANMTYALAAAGVCRSERSHRADTALRVAALEHLGSAPARVLSGGEQQRLALARALALEPELLLLDEPSTSLDPASTAAVETLIRLATAQGTGVVLVTHDLGQARRLADEIAFMHRGRIIERASAREFFERPKTIAARAYLAGDLVL
jgi:tungstate transport system ATP-binding protein